MAAGMKSSMRTCVEKSAAITRWMAAATAKSLRRTRSAQDDFGRDAAGAIVARGERDLRARRGAHGPFALPAIARDGRVHGERLQGDLGGAAVELRPFDARLARHERRAFRQLDLVDHAARHLAVDRALAHV